jgi:hypothetical protein
MPNSYIQLINEAEQLWLARSVSPYICDCLDHAAASIPNVGEAMAKRLRDWIRDRINGHFSVIGYLYDEARDWDVTNHHRRKNVVAFRKQLFVELREAFADMNVQ